MFFGEVTMEANSVVGSQNVLVYVTVNGTIVGWDLRAPGDIWTLKDDPKRGR